MHICDKCKKYNKCYSKSGNTEADITKRAEVELGGCPNYRELTLKEMFFGNGNRGKRNGKSAVR